MEKQRKLLMAAVVLVAVATSAGTSLFVSKKMTGSGLAGGEVLATPTTFAKNDGNLASAIQTDFTYAAERSVHSVVHVKTKYKIERSGLSRDPFFDFFFGRPEQSFPQQPQEQMASGSGVIISPDGYIVTNNHVVDKANEVEVTLNDKRTFKAEIVGVDASTDIALLKITAENLPVIPFGDSDQLKIGEWVLAVGNPFNLTSTVTAGIVSAKARNINILNSDMKIESFIQTDAAVNPGNSGGALVNTNGELVGINTAIASQTGSYAGYSFAVPVSIVGKVVADLKEFGVVQRAVLGVEIRDITDEFAKEKNLKTLNGAYVAKLVDGGSAKEAGVKEGDVITAVNNTLVKSVSQLQEQIGRYRPGDKVKISLVRNGSSQELVVELKNRSGNTSVVKIVDLSQLGAKFVTLSDQLKYKFRLNYGLQVEEVSRNGRFGSAGIQKGYIVLKINNQQISSTTDVEKVLEAVQGADDQEQVLFVSGVYPNGRVAHYAVGLTGK